MNYNCLMLIAAMIVNGQMIYNFETESSLQGWSIVDDIVMGGRSEGRLEITAEGNGHFFGSVSLENNGGFSSVRYSCGNMDVRGSTYAILRLKGDGKRYQFRTKSTPNQRHVYAKSFETQGEWEVIKIPLKEMTPTFRGTPLSIPNYPAETLGEIAILIANKRNESFSLEIDYIRFE